MPERNAQATWEGSLKEGRGTFQFGGGLFEGPFSFSSRFEEARAGCPVSNALTGVEITQDARLI